MTERLSSLPQLPARQFPPEIDAQWRNQIDRDFRESCSDGLSNSRSPEYQMYLGAIARANEARNQLLKENQFLTTEEAVKELGGGEHASSITLAAVRRGSVLAVPDHGYHLYPTFQFDSNRVSPLVGLLHDVQMQRLDGEKPDPWDLLTFFSVRRKLLGGIALKDCLWQEKFAETSRYIIENALV